MVRTLSYGAARRVYDRIGAFQDSQAFYEDATTDELVQHGDFHEASRVFEFGCGTGRFAETLLTKRLPPSAHWRGIDLSPKMVSLAESRLARFGARAAVARSEGSTRLAEADASCDRWISTFVLDLLSDEDIGSLLEEAHRMLVPGGLLCLASLAGGDEWYSRITASLWTGLHALSPELVGGCRPVELRSRLAPDRWRILHRSAHAPFFIPSEAIVALRLPSPSPRK